LPKPLIPIGDKPIIEIIMDKFHQYGVNEFFVSVHHRSRMIKAYFEERPISYKIHYIEEEEPLGTAGSLGFLYDKVKGSILVSNCDIIIESNYHEMVEFHESKKYDITIVGSFRHLTLPYGICFIENGGTLTRIEEKPEYDYLVNTGMYLIKKEVLELIADNRPTAITDLIQTVKAKGGRVGVFPIDEKSWIDVGQWEEYRRAQKILEAD
jgi:NDP-sugar pyrophosphorylase family protein